MHLQTLTNVCQLGLGSGHIIYGVLRGVVCGGWVGGLCVCMYICMCMCMCMCMYVHLYEYMYMRMRMNT